MADDNEYFSGESEDDTLVDMSMERRATGPDPEEDLSMNMDAADGFDGDGGGTLATGTGIAAATKALNGSTSTSRAINAAVTSNSTVGDNYYANKGTVWTSDKSISESIISGVTRSLPESFKTDVQSLSDYRLGTFLKNKGVVNGDIGTMLDGAIDLLRADPATSTYSPSIPSFMHEQRFIPIVLQTEFNLAKDSATQAASNGQVANSTRKPFYVVFDSTPENITFSKGASWAPKEFPGRPEPMQIYASSGASSFTLEGNFFSTDAQAHQGKLAIADRLMALVAPSKAHYMPSPVIVKIGEWKRLRCIVTNVSIKYMGPWWVANKGANISHTGEFKSNTSSTSAEADFQSRNILLSHSPYLFTVTFSFTISSQLNSVQYAEDIMDNGDTGGFKKDLTDKSGYDLTNNSNVNDITTYIDPEMVGVTWNTMDYLKKLGLPTDADGGAKLAAMAKITSGLTATVQTAITNNFGSTITKIFGR